MQEVKNAKFERLEFEKLDPHAIPIVPRDFKKVEEIDQPLKKDFNSSYPLNVFSYNILADRCTTERFKEKLYPNKERAVLQDFRYRSTRILKEIA